MRLVRNSVIAVALALCIPQFASAQSSKAILLRAGELYGKKTTVHAVMNMSMSIGAMGNIATKSIIYSLGTAKYRVETSMLPGPMSARIGTTANSLMVANGTNIFIYRPAMNQYSVIPESKAIKSGMMMNNPSQSLLSPKGLTSMASSVEGTATKVTFGNTACWAIKTRSSMAGQVLTVYVARANYLIKGVSMTLAMGKMSMKMNAIFTSMSFPKSLPASLFIFTPPKGAVKVNNAAPMGMP